jgi:hypothetical protein
LLAELNTLMHQVRPEIRPDAEVGRDIPVHLALTWGAGPTLDPPWSHRLGKKSEQACIMPAQNGCAARDLNPEPAD